MKKLLLFPLLVFLLFSCATVNEEIRPSWIDEAPIVPGTKIFIGKGEGLSEVEARSNAVGDVLSQMSEELGYGLHDQYFRELFTSREIKDLGTVIADEYYWEIDGNWQYFVATTTNEESFNSARSPEFLDQQNRIERIQEYLDSAVEAYKANRDVEAAEQVLEAAIISLEGKITLEGYSPEVLIEKAASYISSIKIDSTKSRKGTPKDSFTFRLVRTKGIWYPVVEDATVECEYEALSIDGKHEVLSHLSKTDLKGQFVFNRTNPYTLRTGTITIKVHLDDDLMFRLSLLANDDLLRPINDALDKGKLVYDYSYPLKEDMNDILFAIAEYYVDGTERDENGVLEDVLNSTLNSQKIENLNIVKAVGEDEEEITEFLLSQYGEYKKIYVIRIGVVGSLEIGDKIYSRSEGKLIILEPKTKGSTVVEDFHFTGSGESEEEAATSSLRTLSEVISGFLLGEF